MYYDDLLSLDDKTKLFLKKSAEDAIQKYPNNTNVFHRRAQVVLDVLEYRPKTASFFGNVFTQPFMDAPKDKLIEFLNDDKKLGTAILLAQNTGSSSDLSNLEDSKDQNYN